MAGDDGEPLDLTDDQVIGDDEEQAGAPGEGDAGDLPDDGEPAGETVIAFADETDEEGGAGDDTPLVKKLRGQLRDAQRQIARQRREPAANDEDPEPVVPAEPGPLADFDYDEDRQREAWRAFREAERAHLEWEGRASKRKAERDRLAEEQARQLEQQRRALGVADYDDRSAAVKDRLTDAQLAILVNGAQNPARLIYALGRSPAKLDQLAAEDNLARFAVMLGGMEKDIKVTKRTPPAADAPVRGGTASASLSASDRQLAKLEKEAERTGDRTELVAYKKRLREQGRRAA